MNKSSKNPARTVEATVVDAAPAQPSAFEKAQAKATSLAANRNVQIGVAVVAAPVVLGAAYAVFAKTANAVHSVLA